MAYTPPNNFVAGNVDAADVEENFGAARDYINSEIQHQDLEVNTFDHTDLQQGEFFGVTDDFNFPVSGDMYSDFFATKSSKVFERRYQSATIKPNKPRESTRFVSIFGKEVFLEQAGHVMITCSFFSDGGSIDPCQGLWFPFETGNRTNANSIRNTYFVAVDGVVDNDTIAMNFNENGGTPSPVSLVATTIADPETLVPAQRRHVYLQWMSDTTGSPLDRGWHKFQIVVNPRNNKVYESHFQLQVECFYDPGADSNVGTRNGMNQKYPAEIF